MLGGGGFGRQRSAAQRPPQQARPQRPQQPQQPPAPGNQLGAGRQALGGQNAGQQANALGNFGAYGSQAGFDKALSDAGLVSQTQARRQMDIWRRGYNSPYARRR